MRLGTGQLEQVPGTERGHHEQRRRHRITD
jgi:hypothetical protein